jgi:hypothetical protein
MKPGLLRLLLWAALAGLPGAVRAQTPADTLIPTMARRPPTAQWVLKFAPLTLLDVNNTIQFGVEHLSRRTRGAWQVEAGYGRGTFALATTHAKDSEYQRSMETWRARAEYRLYNLRDQRWSAERYRRPNGTYVAFDAFFKQVNTHESGIVGRDCINGNCNYRQQYQTVVQNYTVGGHVKIGWQSWFSPRDDRPRWLLDTYIGLGVRTSRTARPGLPADAEVPLVYTGLFSGSDNTVPSVTAGLKVGFAL